MNYSTPSFPQRLEIELASACNLRCTYCPRHYVDDLQGYMDFGLFQKTIDEASRYPQTIIVLHRRGESFLHPRFEDILNYTADKFNEVQMATNATLLNEKKFAAIVNALDFISFSLDAPEAYDKTRIPAKYAAVEKKILKFLDFNQGKVKTQVSMVKGTNTPEENVKVFKEIWQGKVDRIRIYEEHSNDGSFGSLKSPRANRMPCVMPVYEMLIFDNGHIGRCNHDWNGSPLGDLNKQTIREIWHSSTYEMLRTEHRRLSFTDPVCKTCDSWYPEKANQGTGEVWEDV